MNHSSRLLGIAVLAAGALAVSGAAFADVQALGVSATIISANNCRFNDAGPSTLAFGAIDPTSASPATASTGIGFRCTGSSALATFFVASDDGLYQTGPGQPRMRHNTVTTEFLRYSLNLPATGSVPKNTAQTLTVVGTIAPADFANARAGTFADSVVLTISP
jgi:hypothetical protein